MKEIFLILPILFKSGFRKRTGEKGNPLIPHLVLGGVLLFYSVLCGTEMIPVVSKLSETNMLGGFIAMLLVVSALASTLFSIAPMISLLYYSNDGEFFLHLPISQSSVYFAKLIYLYLSQLYITVVISAPLLVIIGITQGLGFLYYVISVLALFITPFFALVLASIVVLPIVALASLFKNKGAVSSVALIVAFALVISAYLALAINGGNMQTSDLVETLLPTIKTVADVAFPFLALSNASILSNVTVFGTLDSVIAAFFTNLAVAVLFFAVVAFIAVIVGKVFYLRGVSTLLENRKITQKGDNVLKKNRQFTSLFKVEYKSVTRNTSLAFNSLGSLVLCPVLAVVFSVSLGGEFLGYIAYGMVYAIIVGMGVSLNSCACMIFSKDGENFYSFKYLPVDKKTVVGAKFVFCWLVSTVSVAVSVIIALIILDVAWYHWFSIIPVALMTAGMTAMNMLWDLRKPNLHWLSISDIAKNSANVLVPTFIGLGVMACLLIACVSFLIVFQELGYLFAYLFVFMVGAILSAIFVSALFRNCEKMIERVE